MDHGTTASYSRGCRCAACRDAWRDAQRRRRSDPTVYRRQLEANQRSRRRVLSEMTGDAGDPRHGTAWGYRAGCRCEACGAAALAAKRRQRAYEIASRARVRTALARDPTDRRHGLYGHTCGCRCARCREARRAYDARARARKADTGSLARGLAYGVPLSVALWVGLYVAGRAVLSRGTVGLVAVCVLAALFGLVCVAYAWDWWRSSAAVRACRAGHRGAGPTRPSGGHVRVLRAYDQEEAEHG